MSKETLKITIKKDGSIESKSHGITGTKCLELLEELIGDIAPVDEGVVLTSDYDDDNNEKVKSKDKIKLDRSRGGSA